MKCKLLSPHTFSKVCHAHKNAINEWFAVKTKEKHQVLFGWAQCNTRSVRQFLNGFQWEEAVRGETSESQTWKSEMTLRIQATWSFMDLLWTIRFFHKTWLAFEMNFIQVLKAMLAAFLLSTLAFPFQSLVGTCNLPCFLSLYFSNLVSPHASIKFRIFCGFCDQVSPTQKKRDLWWQYSRMEKNKIKKIIS